MVQQQSQQEWNIPSGVVEVIVGVAAVGGAIVLGYYLIESLANPGPVGGSCTQPGTNCYEAAAPYLSNFTICAQQYATYLQQYIQEDNAAGTGFTAAQLSVLSNLESCMNTEAGYLAGVAKQYAPTSGLTILANWVGIAVAAVGAGLGIAAIVKVLRTVPKTGSATANVLKNATVENAVDTGAITSDSAASFQSDVSSYTTTDETDNATQINNYASQGLITDAEAADAIAVDDTAMAGDGADVEALLAGL